MTLRYWGIARVSLGMTSESSWDPPPEDSERSQGPGGQSGQGFAYGGQTGSDYAFHQEGDEDDRDSVWGSSGHG